MLPGSLPSAVDVVAAAVAAAVVVDVVEVAAVVDGSWGRSGRQGNAEAHAPWAGTDAFSGSMPEWAREVQLTRLTSARLTTCPEILLIFGSCSKKWFT